MLHAMSEDTVERAHSLANAGDLHGAARVLARYLEAAPADASAHFQLAHMRMELGDAVGAVEHFQRCLALEPDNAVILSDLGTAFEELGRETDAAAAYRKASRMDPPFPPALYNLALILCRRGEWQEAAGHLRVALEQSADFRPARRQLGLALDALGQEHAARACFDELLAADDKDVEARRALAQLDMKTCRFASAAEQLQRCLALAPEDAGVCLALASCLQELGRVDEALVHYRALLRRDGSRYYEVVKKLTSASTGCFWLKASELRRVLLG
jgi:Flp pilus assembly protein TadD